ncbi:unnamed protein product [Fusarium venenatum]|uniref:Uncharacterized protein n=1 Tax=Fusarium venenatum TaxID=56646 RepID=A0A2L2T0E7_9HYPO|nr:uncharacterized protein FVRRES_00464 [Fusarium venenatum]CEI63952.1 unnamed protein product [Fusarium venenatum]
MHFIVQVWVNMHTPAKMLAGLEASHEPLTYHQQRAES